ncbi:MAG TPA: DUF2760 domain-containing protein [Polyangiaceae bacterium]
MTDPGELSFFSRLWLAWLCFFRVLFDARFATRVQDARADRALPAPAPALTRPPTVHAANAVTAALQLLSLLQREGRLVDFLQQDIASFPDAEVGVAARVVHEGCRRALREHASIEPVRVESEGARVKLDEGFDADAVKLVGDVKGEPPWSGTLRHRGWRATRLELPRLVGEHDAHVLAPAEVEL